MCIYVSEYIQYTFYKIVNFDKTKGGHVHHWATKWKLRQCVSTYNQHVVRRGRLA